LVAPLDRANVDTDAIIPKQFLKSIARSGFGPNLFDAWRYLDPGEPGQDPASRKPNPDFVLNQPRYKGASILLARENFGCGSSREHAPWALEANGIRLVIAESFARIFRQNMFNCGILAVELSKAYLDRLFALKGKVTVAVDLEGEKLTATSGEATVECSFSLNAFDKKLIGAGGWLAFADANY